ncbi:MAG: hypothetical protein JXB38_13135 [Anaerolineales bacterium]|nr:hypothetical protein [Anaerolineales bacterium]
MSRVKPYLLPLLILVIFAGLGIGFRTFFMQNMVEPIAILLWTLWQMLAGVDQNIYWALLVVLCTILVINLALSFQTEAPRSAYTTENDALNRVAYWQKLLADATAGDHERELLHDQLKALLLATITQDERTDPTDIELLLANGSLVLPPRVQHFLLSPQAPPTPALLSLAPLWLRRRFYKPDQILIAEILHWMETELELPHD